MKIEINEPVFFSERGNRENNEDSVYPNSGVFTGREDLFIVCDGVGGAARGEAASRLACDTFARYFSEHEVGTTSDDILESFDYVEQEFDKYLIKEPFAKGMGTTLVLMFIHTEGITVAHCGDSRFYHFRDGKIVWRTTDHTYVNDLVKQGIITAEDALLRPKSNRITRAIQGYSVHRSLPDVEIIRNVEPGDIFFLCSDGVYECISDNNITRVFTSENTLKEKMEIIRATCENHSGDNYSGYLIEIAGVETDPVKKNRFSYFKKFTKNAN